MDGCKISSNAAKEWSGTFSDLKKKREKLKSNITYLKKKTKQDVENRSTFSRSKKEISKTISKMKRHIEKIDSFLEENEPKKGKRGGEIQSNITDNESAKCKWQLEFPQSRKRIFPHLIKTSLYLIFQDLKI